MDEYKYLLLIGHPRHAYLLDGQREEMLEVSEDDDEIAALKVGKTPFPIDDAVWDDVLPQYGRLEREQAECYVLY